MQTRLQMCERRNCVKSTNFCFLCFTRKTIICSRLSGRQLSHSQKKRKIYLSQHHLHIDLKLKMCLNYNKEPFGVGVRFFSG